MIRTLNIIVPANGLAPLAVDPDDAPVFDAVEPYGYQRLGVVRCLTVDGRIYMLRDDCPDEGVALWSPAEAEARELTLDAAVAAVDALPTELRAVLRERLKATDHKPYAVRKAKRALDDARATLAAAPAGEKAKARDAVQAAKAALDAAKAAAGITEPEPDES